MPTRSRFLLPLVVLSLAACSDASPEATRGADGLYESDLPGPGGGQGERGVADEDESQSAAAPPSGNGTADAGGDATRAIVEADVIQIAGQRLYALSRLAGLTVIDLSDVAHLKVLGRYRQLNGQPFEMYLRGDVVLAMYVGWHQYAKQGDGNYTWTQTSKVVALDVADPAAIAQVGSFDVAGELSDSRLVGDIMYVVGAQNGYCWGCTENKQSTSVLSLDVRDPRAVRKVDELLFSEEDDTYRWKRSITVTEQRIYIAGPEYGQQPEASTIQVVDISDPGGDLVAGTTVTASGMITSRWQMDEYQGVLRVVSQPQPWWRPGGVDIQKPVIQTFQVASSQSLTALASVPITIPPNETLNTVRFDGPRGYAITSERTDPLFTLDLSDPAQPKQLGELVMPGWVYHLVPRGDRVIGLGYDQGNAEGAITVSVFDVSDMRAPTMLERVNFGGSWASLPEDQDRIHKAFKIDDARGLITVPFSGWTDARGGAYCWGEYRSGVQLIDLAGDDLTLRGAAPSRGAARRAFLHDQALIAVSDEAIDSYDVTDRTQPASLQRVSLARNVSHALPLANGHVARLNEDWYAAQNSSIELVALADVEKPEASVSELSLSELLSPGECNGYAWIQDAFVHGNQIDVSYQRYQENRDAPYSSKHYQGVLSIDASDPARPRVLAKSEEANGNEWYLGHGWYSYGYVPDWRPLVRTSHALVALEQRSYPADNADGYALETRLRVTDLRDPAQPKVTTLVLPRADGYSGLVLDGDDVMLSHYVATGGGRARFYLDPISLADPTAPALGASINVPGSLVHVDRAHQRVLTSELTRVMAEGVTYPACQARFAYASWQPARGHDWSEGAPGTCTGFRETLHMLRLDGDVAALEGSHALAEDQRVSSSSMGDGRVVSVLSHGAGYSPYNLVDECVGPCGRYAAATQPVEVLALGGLDTGVLQVGRLTVSELSEPWHGFWGAPQTFAVGARALLRGASDAAVLDLTDVTKPALVQRVPLYGQAVDLAASGNMVLLSLGMNGVQRLDL